MPYKKPTPEEAAAGRARTLATEKAILNRIEQQHGKLPGGFPKTWAQRHPSIGQFIPESVSSAVGAGADSLLKMMGFGEQPVQYGLDAQGRPLSTQFGADPTQNETVVPKTAKPSKQSDLRSQIMGVLADYAPGVNKQFAIGDDESESVLHGFMDSSEGRDLGSLEDKNELANKARTGYTKFAQKWAGVKDGERRIKIDDAVVLDADTATAEEVSAALASNKATVLKNPEKYGFVSKVTIKGDGKTVKNPEAALDAENPVITKTDFEDILRGLMGGGRG